MTTDRSEPEALRDFVEATLGSDIRIEERSRAFGRKSVTWRIKATDGTGFYLKRHEFNHHFEAEVRALNQWVPLLKSGPWWSTPQVVAVSNELGAVLLTELPGQILEDREGAPTDISELRTAYKHAGRLARLLHDADIDLSREIRVQTYTLEEITRFMEPSRPYLDAATCDWAEEILTADGAWAGLDIVPMHGDYSPRNWIIERGDPTLNVIDWERSRPGYWVEDIQRMTHDHWLDEPRLGDAFFEGYGRTPTDAEWRHSNQITLINAVGGVGWAINHNDAWFEQHNRRTVERIRDIL
ncbi:MAG: aminoglycoside phosphotransferase family protein [Chloroflexi bacterium]|nr:aminoglycoside phosphotransferase family protein [Chloroflexota bacterium]MBT4073876.1 aminoglycoside phosphotransferase family protein [Chloroflexota bacterium]MBT4513524.1 aminoglycoside phosphotransferase family protein [Chloroflexota bacterium]MBT6681767.1 aminoglycoside phosphotransferase family protein [Chloroflexota bacterium]